MRGRIVKHLLHDVFTSSELFSRLDSHARAMLSASLRPRAVFSGHDLCRAGDAADCMWILQTGMHHLRQHLCLLRVAQRSCALQLSGTSPVTPGRWLGWTCRLDMQADEEWSKALHMARTVACCPVVLRFGLPGPSSVRCATAAGTVAAVQGADVVDVLHAPAVLGEAALFQEHVPEAARRACTFRAQVCCLPSQTCTLPAAMPELTYSPKETIIRGQEALCALHVHAL